MQTISHSILELKRLDELLTKDFLVHVNSEKKSKQREVRFIINKDKLFTTQQKIMMICGKGIRIVRWGTCGVMAFVVESGLSYLNSNP